MRVTSGLVIQYFAARGGSWFVWSVWSIGFVRFIWFDERERQDRLRARMIEENLGQNLLRRSYFVLFQKGSLLSQRIRFLSHPSPDHRWSFVGLGPILGIPRSRDRRRRQRLLRLGARRPVARHDAAVRES